MNTEVGSREKGENHKELASAINDLGNVVSRLDSLRDRIQGQDGPKPTTKEDEKLDSRKMCLEVVLKEGPDEIRDKTDGMLALINSIESILF